MDRLFCRFFGKSSSIKPRDRYHKVKVDSDLFFEFAVSRPFALRPVAGPWWVGMAAGGGDGAGGGRVVNETKGIMNHAPRSGMKVS